MSKFSTVLQLKNISTIFALARDNNYLLRIISSTHVFQTTKWSNMKPSDKITRSKESKSFNLYEESCDDNVKKKRIVPVDKGENRCGEIHSVIKRFCCPRVRFVPQIYHCRQNCCSSFPRKSLHLFLIIKSSSFIRLSALTFSVTNDKLFDDLDRFCSMRKTEKERERA